MSIMCNDFMAKDCQSQVHALILNFKKLFHGQTENHSNNNIRDILKEIWEVIYGVPKIYFKITLFNNWLKIIKINKLYFLRVCFKFFQKFH